MSSSQKKRERNSSETDSHRNRPILTGLTEMKPAVTVLVLVSAALLLLFNLPSGAFSCCFLFFQFSSLSAEEGKARRRRMEERRTLCRLSALLFSFSFSCAILPLSYVFNVYSTISLCFGFFPLLPCCSGLAIQTVRERIRQQHILQQSGEGAPAASGSASGGASAKGPSEYLRETHVIRVVFVFVLLMSKSFLVLRPFLLMIRLLEKLVRLCAS